MQPLPDNLNRLRASSTICRERIGFAGIARHAGCLDRNVGEFGQRQKLGHVSHLGVVFQHGVKAAAAEVIDGEAKPRVVLGDLPE